MSDLLAEQLKRDVSGFETQVSALTERKKGLLTEIDQVESEICKVEPLYNYAKSLLASTPFSAPVTQSKTAAATAAATAARKRKAEQRQAAKQSGSDQSPKQ